MATENKVNENRGVTCQSQNPALHLLGDGFSIRPVRPDETSAILEVYRQCEDFLALGPVPTASLAMVLADLALSRQHSRVFCGIYEAQPDGLGPMVGVLDVVLGGAEGRPECADLALLMIAAPHRHHGLGRKVVALVEEAIRRDPSITTILSGVQVNNPPAIRFWTRNGYRIVGGPELMPDQTTVYHLRKDVEAIP